MKHGVSVALIKSAAPVDQLNGWLKQREEKFEVEFVLAWHDPLDSLPRYAVNLNPFEWDGESAWSDGWRAVRVHLEDGVKQGHLAAFEPTRWVGAI